MAKTCPKCGNELNANDFCERCKKTIKTYEKIRDLSKLLYNEGLQKAKARDLSGAVETLSRSIKYDKTNIDARNLLGLVYFEMGEAVLSLQQWVISRNLKTENNLANKYLDKIQNNQSNLDKLNTSIKKYNQALIYIQQNSVDLAVIQLKKIITLNPKFIKAYCLLALAYIKEDDMPKAKRELLKVLAIDKNNYVARKYYNELNSGKEQEVIPEPEKDVVKERKQVRRQVAINQSLQQFLGVVFGLFIGAALIYFLIMPSRLDQKDTDIEARQTQLDILTTKANGLDSTVTSNNEKIKNLEMDLKNAVEENEQLSLKDEKVQKIMLSMTSYLEDNLIDSASYLDSITIEDSTDGVLNNLYEQLKGIIFAEVGLATYNQGKTYYNAKNYESATESLALSVKYVKDAYYSDAAVYFLGRSYQFSEKPEEAIIQYKYLLANYPESGYRGYCETQIVYLGGTLDE